jgi:hypothetical protein
VKGREGAAGEAGHRVELFLDANADAVKPFVSAQCRANLDASVDEFDTLWAQQIGSKGMGKGMTAALKQMRKDIYVAFLEPIAIFAKHVKDPRLIVYGKVKRQREFLGNLEMLAQVAPKYESELIAFGFPTDILAKLRAAVDDIQNATDVRGRSWGSGAGATGGLAGVNTKIRANIDIIEGNMTPLLNKNGELRAEWETARRMRE